MLHAKMVRNYFMNIIFFMQKIQVHMMKGTSFKNIQ